MFILGLLKEQRQEEKDRSGGQQVIIFSSQICFIVFELFQQVVIFSFSNFHLIVFEPFLIGLMEKILTRTSEDIGMPHNASSCDNCHVTIVDNCCMD